MTCWVLVPIKARQECKTRLRQALPEEARLALVRAMLRHVLTTVAATPGVGQVAILSPERDDVADDVTMLVDDGRGLNAALQHALTDLQSRGATTALILHADLPLLRSDDIAALLAAGKTHDCVLAPDYLDQGTNAILVCLPTPLQFQFGRDSFAKHQAEAKAHGLPTAVVRSPTLAFDLDEPAAMARTTA